VNDSKSGAAAPSVELGDDKRPVDITTIEDEGSMDDRGERYAHDDHSATAVNLLGWH
jgi:hypothetical protein